MQDHTPLSRGTTGSHVKKRAPAVTSCLIDNYIFQLLKWKGLFERGYIYCLREALINYCVALILD